MGAVQRLATVVIVGLVALSTMLVLYLADENNRIAKGESEQQTASIERATNTYILQCLRCHGPAGLGVTGPDAKDANGNPTGRVGGVIGGVNATLNHTGSNDKGTPYAGGNENGVTFAAGFTGRTEWIHNRITNGLWDAKNQKYRMPPFADSRGGPLNSEQINELVTMIQHGDWNEVYNQSIAASGGQYPTPPPAALSSPPVVGSPPAQGTPATGPATAIEIDMDDIKFDQTEVTIPAGKDVAVTLANKGASTHNFNIDALNIHSGDYEPGKKGTVTVNAPAGTYEYYCNIPGHKEAGMVGKLIVTADSAGGAPSTVGTPGSPAAAASAATPGAATTSVAAAPAPASSSAPVSLSMVDIAFEPTELTIAANTDVVVNLVNNGAGPHNFDIDALKIHSGEYAAGQKGSVTINAPAGTYEYYCSQPGHKEAGMVGKLIVK